MYVQYNTTLPWIIRSDSSDHAVGAVLFQEYTNFTGNIIHQPISFASHKYSGKVSVFLEKNSFSALTHGACPAKSLA